MTLFQAAFLGLIQGLTEFLPVSSSGHLIFLPAIFGWTDQGIAFDVVLHVGSLLAVIIYFRSTLLRLIRAFFSRGTVYAQERRFAWLLLLSIIPAGSIGLLLDSNSRSALVVGVNLIFWGILLGIADRYAQKHATDSMPVQNISVVQVIGISFVQALALIPGTSRSGVTMTAGLFSGLSKKTAAEFSFLMSVPVIGAAGALKILELVDTGLGGLTLLELVVGFCAAALSGWLAIAGLMKIIQKWSFMPFVVYRVIIGIIILVTLV